MYYLMNKDCIVAEFCERKKEALDTGVVFEVTRVEDKTKLPFGFGNINAWIDSRKSSKHNTHLKAIMTRLGCEDNEGFIRITHAASINDTFWIRSDKESVQWSDISLYRNQFTEMISKLAFEGVGLYGEVFSSASPELSCEGSFRKCFRKENEEGEYGSDIFIYKRGSIFKIKDIEIRGIEPYCEAMASEIAQIISPENAVSYEINYLHGKLATKCNVFSSEEYGYASLVKVYGATNDLNEIMKYFEQYGSEQYLREMLVIDALCFNEDRHAGNYGFVFSNDTMQIQGIAPVFDFNISLMPYFKLEDFADVGDKLIEIFPKLGEDFTRVGQLAMNDTIRDRVKNIRDFSFSFRGNEEFPEERVRFIEEIVHRQAEALLSREKLYTKDVFFSQALVNQERHNQEGREAQRVLDGFYEVAEKKMGNRFLFSISNDINLVELYAEIDSYEVKVNFVDGTFKILNGVEELTLAELSERNEAVGKAIKDLRRELKRYVNENHYKAFKKLNGGSEQPLDEKN